MSEELHPFLDANEWEGVSSSWIDEARYDRAAGELWIRTKGRDYAYPCDERKALEFWRASSKGGWINQNFPRALKR